MKKTRQKKYLPALALALSLLLLLAGCSGKQATIVGQWQSIGRSDAMKLLDATQEIWVFAEDGTATQYWDGESEPISQGKYEIDEDNVVTISFFSAPDIVFELNENELMQDGVAVMVRLGQEES